MQYSAANVVSDMERCLVLIDNEVCVVDEYTGTCGVSSTYKKSKLNNDNNIEDLSSANSSKLFISAFVNRSLAFVKILEWMSLKFFLKLSRVVAFLTLSGRPFTSF